MVPGKKMKNEAVRKRRKKWERKKKRGRVIFLLIYGKLVDNCILKGKMAAGEKI